MQEKIGYDEILSKLEGVQPGDTLYVVSDILQLSIYCREQKVRFDINRFLDSILEKVGTDGTVLIPTFNWGFCKGETFDRKKTVSKTGALGNAALKRPDFKRTRHPLYSFAVWGKQQEKLTEMDPVDSFGEGTVFEYMYEQEARVLVIGLPALQGTTYIHHVEQVVGVPYRYHKEFRAPYVDSEGAADEKTYRMYVRDLEKDPKHIQGFRPLEEKMRAEGLIHTRQYCGVDFSTLGVRDLHEAVKEDILNNDSRNLYVYHGQAGAAQESAHGRTAL